MHLRTLLLLLSIAAAPGAVFAYVGPGAGLSAIGAALALVGAILLGIIGFLWYPIKRLMKRKQAGKQDPATEEPALSRDGEQPVQPGEKEAEGR